MTAPLLTVRGVKTFYGRVMALKGVDLDVNEGEIVTLIGANGAGKSTLMMTICGNPRGAGGMPPSLNLHNHAFFCSTSLRWAWPLWSCGKSSMPLKCSTPRTV